MASTRIRPGVWFGVLVLLGVIWLIAFSPIDSDNRRLDPDERKQRKKEAAILALIFYFIHLALLLFGKERYAVCVGVGILQIAGLQMPCILQKMTEKTGNESFRSEGVEK